MKFKGKSKFEISLGRELTQMGAKFSYEKEKWQYKLKPYNAKCSKCGSNEVYETRIYTPDFFLFMQDNFLTKSRKKKYSTWCEQQGITYAIGSIPKEWT